MSNLWGWLIVLCLVALYIPAWIITRRWGEKLAKWIEGKGT